MLLTTQSICKENGAANIVIRTIKSVSGKISIKQKQNNEHPQKKQKFR